LHVTEKPPFEAPARVSVQYGFVPAAPVAPRLLPGEIRRVVPQRVFGVPLLLAFWAVSMEYVWFQFEHAPPHATTTAPIREPPFRRRADSS